MSGGQIREGNVLHSISNRLNAHCISVGHNIFTYKHESISTVSSHCRMLPPGKFNCTITEPIPSILPRDAYAQRRLCCRKLSLCPSICLSVTRLNGGVECMQVGYQKTALFDQQIALPRKGYKIGTCTRSIYRMVPFSMTLNDPRLTQISRHIIFRR